MEFEIDVSGNDILEKNYAICIANKDSLIKGFKFNQEIIEQLNSNYSRGLYKYEKTKRGNKLFKIRLYSIVIFYLFKSVSHLDNISLKICRDFSGHENDINNNLREFLTNKLGLKINSIYYGKLDEKSNAHKYSFLMRKDIKNLMKDYYIQLNLNDLEMFLKK